LEGLQIANFDQCLHIVQTLSVFFWFDGGVERRGLFGGSFPWRNLSWGKKISMKGEQDFLEFFKRTMKQ